jgi:hypothetical protein
MRIGKWLVFLVAHTRSERREAKDYENTYMNAEPHAYENLMF